MKTNRFFLSAAIFVATSLLFFACSKITDGEELNNSSYRYIGTPQDVAVVANSANSITVTWSAVSGAAGYYIYRGVSDYSTYIEVGETHSTNFTDNNLSVGTTYFYKVAAYSNSYGIGSQSSHVYTTTHSLSTSGYTGIYGELVYKGQTYKTVVIGNQTWMAENLNYNADGSRCNSNNDANCITYGRLYDYSTTMALPDCNIVDCSELVQPQHQGICPDGWHIPSNSEWNTLINYVGGSETAGKFLKAANGWEDCGSSGSGYFYSCEDSYGFAALPGGSYLFDSYGFRETGESGYWWVSDYNTGNYREMSYNSNGLRLGSYYTTSLYSVRCVQNTGDYPSSSSGLDISSSSNDDELSSSSSSDDNYDYLSSSSDGNENNPSEAWIIDGLTMYIVSDGVASVYYDMDYNYSYYTDNMNFSYQSNYTISSSSVNEYDTYTYTSVITAEANILYTRNGNTVTSTTNSVSDSRTSIVYVNPSTDDYESIGHSETTQTSNTELDSETGLTLQSTFSQTSVTNYGEPTVIGSTTNYTLDILSEDSDGTITVKATPTTSSVYYIYKVKDKVILESKYYSSENVLSYTQSYSFPDDAIIRDRLPTFTLYSVTYETISNYSYQTVEVLTNTATELTLRVKTYNANGLSGQQDTRYRKW